jgi:hypothetical protein
MRQWLIFAVVKALLFQLQLLNELLNRKFGILKLRITNTSMQLEQTNSPAAA